ncbi:Stasimon [Carabus blaptoides fortunei]
MSTYGTRAGNANHPTKTTLSTRYALLSVLLIFIFSLSALFYVYMSFPELEENEKSHIKIPWDIEEAKNLGIVLDRYKDRYFFEVLSGIFATYVFLQTFAIPVPFAMGTFLGVGPPSFVAIQAGQTLYKMSSSSDAWSWSSVILLAVFALLSLIPVVLKQRLREKFE